MLKYLTLNFLVCLCGASVIQTPFFSKESKEVLHLEDVSPNIDLWEKWGPHIRDFENLINMDSVIEAAVPHLNDPDVINFFEFILSPQFKEVVLKFQSVEEFKEVIEYLHSQGFEAKPVVDIINSEIDLPPNKDTEMKAHGKGVTDLVESIVNALPIENMKKLLEDKIENSPDVAKLFKTITSEDLMDILRRLSKNPKYLEIRNVLEGYGLDFVRLRVVADNVLGDYFKNIKKENNVGSD